ncbi:hypothetical protein [Sandaracinus amylolyticus]|uniref:Kelch-like 5 protein n=1 Tax=Sandaracinus amylolyticus TaxID=927083 RepID=A0A0F6YHD4_9BACT|nr:hypothetical protein [Sandaracinus amylolyticus]AKF04951.1 kelch-like 5 protein [Sandaracinus amylolyticus]
MRRRSTFVAALLLASIACTVEDDREELVPCRVDRDCPGGSCRAGLCSPIPCVDDDADGRGEGCSMGPDCDDGDPMQTGLEVCDGRDNDCDGDADDGLIITACGSCMPGCTELRLGAGGSPFDAPAAQLDGVSVGEDGVLSMEAPEPAAEHLIWIPSTGDGTIVKVDVQTFEPLARYRTGPNALLDEPSRTAVDVRGDVYVTNVHGESVTRIAARPALCPDRDGDGTVRTSSGPDDVLPWGEDECVLWNHPMPDARPTAIAVRDEAILGGYAPRVWVGGVDTELVYQLDGDTGEELFRFSTPEHQPATVFAIDARGQLFSAPHHTGIARGFYARIDTTRCVDEPSCAAAACGPSGDDCVRQVLDIPACSAIALGPDGLLHLGCPYHTIWDPRAPLGRRLGEPNGESSYVRNLVADARGNVFVADAAINGVGVVRVDPATGETVGVTPWPYAGGAEPQGLSVDDEGKVWVINAATGDATVIAPGEALDDNTVWSGVVPILRRPDAWTDMTTRLGAAPRARGLYRYRLDTCDGGVATITPELGRLTWEAGIPVDASMTVRVRTAASQSALAAARWLTVATIAPDAPPIDVGDVLAFRGEDPAQIVELELALDGTARALPRVLSVRLAYRAGCEVPR